MPNYRSLDAMFLDNVDKCPGCAWSVETINDPEFEYEYICRGCDIGFHCMWDTAKILTPEFYEKLKNYDIACRRFHIEEWMRERDIEVRGGMWVDQITTLDSIIELLEAVRSRKKVTKWWKDQCPK